MSQILTACLITNSTPPHLIYTSTSRVLVILTAFRLRSLLRDPHPLC